MENLKVLKKACADGVVLAFATAVNNIPNVRIVNYVWDEKMPNKIYFTSDSSNCKVKELGDNRNVAIYSVPTDIDAGTSFRSNHAIAQKSDRTVKELQHLFLEKMPSYGEALEHIGDSLDVFEIVLENALITIDFENTVSINFGSEASSVSDEDCK